MINPAVQPRNELNDFTSAVRRGNGDFSVRLRNGDVVKPVFYDPPADMVGLEEQFFHVPDSGNFGYRWNLDGSGIKNYTFDMMEIVNNKEIK